MACRIFMSRSALCPGVDCHHEDIVLCDTCKYLFVMWACASIENVVHRVKVRVQWKSYPESISGV